MKIKKLKEHLEPLPHQGVRVKKMGKRTEVRYMTSSTKSHIEKLDKDFYINKSTGEVKEFKHTENRAESVSTARQSMQRLRELIYTNVTHPRNCRWLTLTYAENMTDPQRLYDDFRKFNMRFQTHLKHHHNCKAEYIAIAEPQSRGAWHLHLLYIFEGKAPYVSNDTLASIWRHGFTKIKAMQDTDNVAMYVSAYLCDLSLDEALSNNVVRLSEVNPSDIKTVDVKSEDGKPVSKSFIKGARLKLYPPHMRLFRTSRGIAKPEIIMCREATAQKYVANADLVYEKTISLSYLPEDSTDNNLKELTCINYRIYDSRKHMNFKNQSYATGSLSEYVPDISELQFAHEQEVKELLDYCENFY